MKLVIAEKPSVARDLARVLGIRSRGDGVLEGSDYAVSWCIGHLVELAEPAAYDGRWKAWRLDNLPMLPDEFQLVGAKHAYQQLRIVTRLLKDKRFDVVINACDAGREGELIFRYVYQQAHSRLPIQRLWISSLTDDAIRRGFGALQSGRAFEPLADAARSRSEADWLVGMNATRAVTVRGRDGGGDALYSIGRVQTPTLAMVVARDTEIAEFKARPYWEVHGRFETADGGRFAGTWRAISVPTSPTSPTSPASASTPRVATAAIADAIVSRDTPAPARVERVRAKTVREAPPLLFDLTSLQRTANRRFGWPAQRTLDLAQTLYERHKVLTYPRTDSRHLTADVARELPTVFEALTSDPDYAPFARALLASPPKPTRRVVDDSKVHDHHAIIPTGKHAGGLDRDEARLYDLVVRRFLGAFFPDAEFAVTKAWISVDAHDAARSAASSRPSGSPSSALPPPELEPPRNGAGGAPDSTHARGQGTPTTNPTDDRQVPIIDALPPPPDRYVARGRVRLVAGWQEVAGIGNDASSRDDVLPPLTEGEALTGSYRSMAKHTSPPPHYTEATLLGAMETAGRSIDDDALRAAMKDCGLGTPATRASIIETLLRRTYISRDRTNLISTATGRALIRALPTTSLASAELTGSWEARLARIARGQDSRPAFMTDIRRYVTEIVDAIRGAAPPDAPPTEPIGRCPRCAGPVIPRRRDFGCTRCEFAMSNRVAGRTIAAPLAAVLLRHGKSQVLRGFRSKKGKTFSAVLRLEPDGRVAFEFGDSSGRGDKGGSSDRHDNGGSSDQHANGGSSDRHTDGGSSDRHANGGSSDRHDNGGSSDRHDNGGSSGRGDNGGSSDRHANGGSSDRHANGGSSDRHANGGSSDRHANGGSSDRHANDGSSGRGDNGGSSGRGANGGSSDRHASGGSSHRHANGGSSDRHANGGSSDRHANGGSSDRHDNGGSSDRHANGGFSDLPRARGRIKRGSTRGQTARGRTAGTGSATSATSPTSPTSPSQSLAAATDRKEPTRTKPRRSRTSVPPGTPLAEKRATRTDATRTSTSATTGTRTSTSDMTNAAPSAGAPASVIAELGLTCPRCQQGHLMAGSRGWGCSRWREGCRFVVWFVTAGKKLTTSQLRELVTRGKTRKSKFGAIDGRLVLDVTADGGNARLEPVGP